MNDVFTCVLNLQYVRTRCVKNAKLYTVPKLYLHVNVALSRTTYRVNLIAELVHTVTLHPRTSSAIRRPVVKSMGERGKGEG